MNWTDVLNQFQGQGSIFWIAALSIAAGATLLVVSGLFAARRGLARLSLPAIRLQRPARGYRRAVPGDTASQVETTNTGYQATGMAALGGPRATDPPAHDDLAQLHARLQAATRKLEGIQEHLKAGEETGLLSGLKGAKGDVEYVFRAGIG